MNVSDILREKGGAVVTASPDDSVTAVLAVLAERNIGAVVVLGPGAKVVGILSERDIVRGLAAHGASLLDRRAADLMTRAVHTCTPGTPVETVMAAMSARKIRHVPVIEGGALAGIVSIGDVVKNRLDELERETSMLQTIIRS